jgi:hypothetical protein
MAYFVTDVGKNITSNIWIPSVQVEMKLNVMLLHL